MKIKPNKNTPGSNMLWEGSRMMLPEHREALIEQRRRINVLPKPVLDDQELQTISAAVYESFVKKTLISLVVYGEYEYRTITGRVLRVDIAGQRIRIEGDWVEQKDIVGMAD